MNDLSISIEPGLGVRGAVVTYGSRRRLTTAVAGVDLDVTPGQILALLGPSGCGKSSLLRAIAGLEPLAAGQVAWDGEALSSVPVHRRGFGLMFQDGQLFGHRDVAGNVAYGLRGTEFGSSRSSQEERVAQMLDLVGLAGYERRTITTLSGGQAQRVALARALAPSPRLLLLDEPLSSLDRGLREELSAELGRVLRAAGTTALYVTHDHDEAFTVADRVGVMIAGSLVRLATPGELWNEPGSAEVARFLGFQVLPDGDSHVLVRPGGLQVVEPAEAGATSDGEVTGEVRGGVVISSRFRRGEREFVVDAEGWGEVVALASTHAEVETGARVQLLRHPDR